MHKAIRSLKSAGISVSLAPSSVCEKYGRNTDTVTD